MNLICKLTVLIFVLTSILNSQAQEVLKLDKDDTLKRKGSITQLEWLEGYWEGEGFGGQCDEIWMPAIDNSMLGIFRFSMDDTLNFSEFIVIEEIDSSLTVKLKHFSRDLTPWEEKDEWTKFKLIKIEDQTAWFNGLTYHRSGNKLIIKLAFKTGEKSTIEEFVFTKKQL
ncbi:MAG: DUF6265 family protein [Brumimicrobium sp.]